MSLLSIILIPQSGDWEALETSLVSVLENRPPRCEIVVVLDRDYPDPYGLEGEVRFVRPPGRRRLVGLLNAGFATAGGEIVHVLLGGATVYDGWTAAALRRFTDPQLAAVAPLVLDADCPPRVLLAGCTWSWGGAGAGFGRGRQADEVESVSRPWIGPGFAAAFYRRSAVAEAGALDATLSPELAAIDLALRLRQSGRRCQLECASRVSIEPRRLCFAGPFKQGWDCERLFWRHASSRGWWWSLAAHGGAIVADALRSLPGPDAAWRIIGRAVGICDRRGPRLTPIAAAPADLARRTADGVRRVDAQHAAPPARRSVRAVNQGAGEERS